ncbi:MAG: helix-turn-helix transcriptional regulator [Anaerolineae bacterium]|jgi:LuxR family maltose regulon positive regulatory protein
MESETFPAPPLTTKLRVPRVRPNLVARRRLTERLNQGLRRKLTLVSAPPGFGKTTLLCQWIAQSQRRVAWMSLDDGDNDPTRFWKLVVGSLQTLSANLGINATALLRAQLTGQPPIEAVLASLINDIAAIPTTDAIALVLDDYQFIKAQSIHDALAFFIDYLPPQLHLVVASQVDPPLRLSRLRERGELAELHTPDLRFTREEVEEFLKQSIGLSLSATEVTALETRSEGWIAALQLAALLMRDKSDMSDLMAAFTGNHRHVLDYLTQEVLCRQPEDVQTFLLQTSILKRLTPSLCNALSGRSDGQAMLETLEGTDLFVLPLDEERHWYHYHHLLAEFLRHRLRQTQAERVPELHRRAAEWNERNGFVSEAIEHALAAEDFERAARLVEGVARLTLRRGEITTVQGWLDALPDDMVRSRGRLGVARAWVLLLSSQLETVEAWLQVIGAPPCAGLATEEAALLQGEIPVIRAVAASYRDDPAQAIECCQQALAHLAEDDLSMRAVVLDFLGVAYRLNGDLYRSSQALVESININRAVGSLYPMLDAMCNLAIVEWEQAQLRYAAQIVEQAAQWVSDSGGPSLPMAGIVQVLLGSLEYEWNDLHTSLRHVLEGLELGEMAQNADALLYGYMTLARLKQAHGDLRGALEAIRSAEQEACKHTTCHMASLAAAQRVRVWLAAGNQEDAAKWAQEYVQETPATPVYERELTDLALARVLIAQGRIEGSSHLVEDALSLLEPMLPAAEGGGRMGRVLEILVLQSLALDAQGNTLSALVALGRALVLAEPEGYVRLFIDEGAPMQELLRQAARHGVAPEYVSRLLVAFADERRIRLL